MINAIVYAPLWRRLFAAVYDAILCVSLAIVLTCILLFFNDGVAFKPNDWRYQLVLLTLLYCFFVGFWTHGGQTAGMIAWKIKVCDHDGSALSYKQASIRFAGMLLVLLTCGLGMLSVLFTKRKIALHDWLTKTHVLIK